MKKLLVFLFLGTLTIWGCSKSHQKAGWPEKAGSDKGTLVDPKKERKNVPSDRGRLSKPKKEPKDAPVDTQ